MLEKIGSKDSLTVSNENHLSMQVLKHFDDAGIKAPMIAEIGVGVGVTTLAMARYLDNRGAIHIFDYEDQVLELYADLSKIGYNNIFPHGNSNKHWDSYNWSLAAMISEGKSEIFDYIYIDGAHSLAVDGLAFVLCDRLLKVGGLIEFDDYLWTFAGSSCMPGIKHLFMTNEQAVTPQVKIVVDLLVSSNVNYDTVMKDRLFRKVGRTHRVTEPHT